LPCHTKPRHALPQLTLPYLAQLCFDELFTLLKTYTLPCHTAPSPALPHPAVPSLAQPGRVFV